MVSKPSPSFLPAHARHDFGALIHANFKLWQHSLRSSFWPMLAYSLLSQLTLLPWRHYNPYLLPGLTPERLRQAAAMKLHSLNDVLDLSPSMQLPWLDGLGPSLGIGLIGNVLALPFLLVVILRQMQLVRGQIEAPQRHWAVVFRRLPSVMLASLLYALLNLLALAPVGLAWWLGVGSDDQIWRLFLILIGLLLCAAPLAWISIAACFYAPLILSEGIGPWAAIRQSIRQIRGRWVLCASLLTISLLCWAGIYGTVSGLPNLLSAAIAVLREDFFALLRTDWIVWGQFLATPLLALTLPLVSAAYVLCAQALDPERPPHTDPRTP